MISSYWHKCSAQEATCAFLNWPDCIGGDLRTVTYQMLHCNSLAFYPVTVRQDALVTSDPLWRNTCARGGDVAGKLAPLCTPTSPNI